MKRLAVIVVVCLCVGLALSSAFPGEAKKAGPVTKPAPPKAATPKAAAPAMKYNEAPMLAALVKAGKLPSVDKRLPDHPLVVPVEEIGQYGGTWRRGFLGPSDANNYVRVVYDALVRFSPDGSKVEPKLIESWEAGSDYSSWTLRMRKGARWSDGQPFTADDIMFWYNDVLLNKQLTPSLPRWIISNDRSVATVQKVDQYTVKFTFKEGNTLFLLELANQDGADRSYACFLPAHYLKKFHPKYRPQAEIDKMVADAKFRTWVELFAKSNAPPENPERPTMAAWVPTTRVSDPILVLKRNPYFVGVDAKGNQLPYIDEVQFRFFQDKLGLNLAAVAGEFDEQERHIDMPNYPALKENEQKGNYRVITWPTFGGSDAIIVFNQTYKGDPVIADLLRTRDFRIALSYAINRNQIREAAFLGLGEPRQPVPAPWTPYYPGDAVAKKYTEYKPDEANKLLDKIGLDKKDSQGIRLMKDGKPATIEISVVPAFANWPDVAQLVAKDWEKVGVRAIVQIRERAAHFQMRDSDELQTEIWNEDTTGFPFTGATKMDPRSTPGLAQGRQYRQWFVTSGQQGMEPPAEIKKLVQSIDSARLVSPDKQGALAKEMYTLWVDQQILIGTIGLSPMVQGVVVVNSSMRNVPTTLGNDWPLRTPGNARPEQFFFKK